MTQLVNGVEGALISSSDRGLMYGDGFFTTLRVQHGIPELWDHHVARLALTSERLGIPLPDVAQLLAEIKLVSTNLIDCVVRVTVTRGQGGRGYAPPQEPQPTRIVESFDIPKDYESWRSHGIDLGFAQMSLPKQHKRLAGLKTLNRIEQVLLKQELMHDSRYHDLLVLHEGGFVLETTAANIFWRTGDQWFTPAMTEAGIQGVVRAYLLAENPKVIVGEFPYEDVLAADEAFICNSLLGLAPVRTIEGAALPIVKPYPKSFATRLS